MENRQRTIRKLLWRITAVLAVLAVVSICFVSGTFARYVTKKSGSTTTDVAKWDIDVTTKDGALTTSTFALVNKLSPSMKPFPAATTPEEGGQATVTNREKSSGTVLVLKIENKGDVDAQLVITPQEKKALTFYVYDTEGKTRPATDDDWGDGFAMEDGLVSKKPSLLEAQVVITMQFALTTEEITDQNESKFESEWKPLSGLNLDKLILKAAAQGSGAGGTAGDDTSTGDGTQAGDETQTTETSVYYFYVRSKWTSRDQHYYQQSQQNQQNQQTAEDMSDGLDTWLGENIAALGGEFTFAAIQASEWPTTETP